MSTIISLAIETSCDETAVAVVKKTDQGVLVLSNAVSSQVKLHAKWGGVVPNLAAREHVKNITRMLELALEEAQITPAQIDLLSITNGPGLIPALLVGTTFAKNLAYLWEKPLVGIHHIEGHIYANFVTNKISSISKKITVSKLKNIKKNDASLLENCELKIENSQDMKFPILCLVVSGGHTQLVLMKDHFKYKIIGQTLDDAVGEAFDKVARILNIGYPGGPAVSKYAEKYDIRNTKYEIRLPRPMLNKKNFNFSFSGLKTAVLYEAKKNPELLKDKKYVAALCHEFQQAAVDVLVQKTLKAAEEFQPKTIMLAGGVSANKQLREQLGNAIQSLSYLSNQSHPSYFTPALNLTGDNAAMIATAAALRWEKMSETQKKKALLGWQTIQPDANLKLK
ncbi:MAG TPA: tRNA (adenosine(37)-N6)-threonylcarbamoyltransferase complex transferase subunit TsaD [Patescibacteria group bacterium]